MASFDIAYNQYIKPNEGGYALVPNDKGGETYAGIARNYNPTWPGWTYVDFVKRTKGSIEQNATFPDIQYLVDQFYMDRWNVNRFGEINNQAVANLLFDFHVHSQSIAIRTIQHLLGVTTDGQMGPVTVAAINNADPAQLHDQLKAARLTFLKSLIEKDPSQADFAAGWFARVAKFPTLLVENAAQMALVAVGIGLLIAGYYLFGQKKTITTI